MLVAYSQSLIFAMSSSLWSSYSLHEYWSVKFTCTILDARTYGGAIFWQHAADVIWQITGCAPLCLAASGQRSNAWAPSWSFLQVPSKQGKQSYLPYRNPGTAIPLKICIPIICWNMHCSYYYSKFLEGEALVRLLTKVSLYFVPQIGDAEVEIDASCRISIKPVWLQNCSIAQF